MEQWKTLREIASTQPGIDIDAFVTFATQEAVHSQYQVTALPYQTVYGCADCDALLDGFKRSTEQETVPDSFKAIKAEVSARRSEKHQRAIASEQLLKSELLPLQERCGKLGHRMIYVPVAGWRDYCEVCGCLGPEAD